MVLNRPYTFSCASGVASSNAVFSWSGCTLEVSGQPAHSYVASETPMTAILQLQGQLDSRRAAARSMGSDGPRVLVAGPADSGKSSLCRILANYLARSGHSGTLVDLDIASGEHLVPGALCAIPICRPLDIEGSTEDLTPLAHWLGHTSAAEHVVQLKQLLSTLAQTVRRRHEADAAARAGGMVINSIGWVDGAGYEMLLQVSAELGADVLVVIGDDRLHSQLISYAQSAPGSPSVVKLAKSGGVVARTPASRQLSLSGRVHEYLYGAKRELFPHSLTLDFGAVNVCSIGVAPKPPKSALPMGMRIEENLLAAKQLPHSLYPSLSHSVLALVYSESGLCDDLLAANVVGFVWVSGVDLEKQKITLLAPSPLAMPALWLLAGSIKWNGEAAK